MEREQGILAEPPFQLRHRSLGSSEGKGKILPGSRAKSLPKILSWASKEISGRKGGSREGLMQRNGGFWELLPQAGGGSVIQDQSYVRDGSQNPRLLWAGRNLQSHPIPGAPPTIPGLQPGLRHFQGFVVPKLFSPHQLHFPSTFHLFLSFKNPLFSPFPAQQLQGEQEEAGAEIPNPRRSWICKGQTCLST